MADEKDYRELLKLTKIKAPQDASDQGFLKKLRTAVDKLTDAEWEGLSEGAQVWANKCSKANAAGKPLPEFEFEASDDDETAPKKSKRAADEDDDDEEPAPKKSKRSAKPADEDEDDEPAPKKSKRAAAADDEDEDEEGDDDMSDAKKSTAKKSTAKKSTTSAGKPAAKKASAAAPAKKATTTPPAKKASAKPAARSGGSGLVSAIRKLVVTHPEWDVASLVKKLEAKGFEASASTVSTIRSDARATLRIAKENNVVLSKLDLDA